MVIDIQMKQKFPPEFFGPLGNLRSIDFRYDLAEKLIKSWPNISDAVLLLNKHDKNNAELFFSTPLNVFASLFTCFRHHIQLQSYCTFSFIFLIFQFI